jgi:hypothetical protein
MSDNRSKVAIYLKGGAMLEFTTDSITVTKSRLDNVITGLKWENAKPDPFFICLDDIAAVLVEDDAA